MIDSNTFEFLSDLKKNNNRDWFNEHKPRYQQAHQNVADFMDTLIGEVKKVDNIENESGKKSMFRIYRDVRFSKDKSPYKTSLSGSLKRATKWLRGGYYVHFEPGNVFLGVGFWNPNSADLKLIRDELAHDANPLRAILTNSEFKETWGELQGEQVKTAPKGFAKDHPNIDLIRFKSFTFMKSFSDEEARSEDFVFEVVKAFLAIRPFFDYMSEVLTRHIKE
ncbi:MAG: DUF2461 domain-containing protein [Balneolaceae bacterium]|nr:DUF2461 domain-containing protein [Balneolaceae bacterium]